MNFDQWYNKFQDALQDDYPEAGDDYGTFGNFVNKMWLMYDASQWEACEYLGY